LPHRCHCDAGANQRKQSQAPVRSPRRVLARPAMAGFTRDRCYETLARGTPGDENRD
jgi:hypothetical protein